MFNNNVIDYISNRNEINITKNCNNNQNVELKGIPSCFKNK